MTNFKLDLNDALEVAVGWPYVRRARAIVALGNRLAESALESLVRLKLHDDGFPQPELQVDIDEYRVDLLLRAQRVIVESRVEIGRLLPQLIGQLVPAQPTSPTLGVDSVDERGEVEQRQVCHRRRLPQPQCCVRR